MCYICIEREKEKGERERKRILLGSRGWQSTEFYYMLRIINIYSVIEIKSIYKYL